MSAVEALRRLLSGFHGAADPDNLAIGTRIIGADHLIPSLVSFALEPAIRSRCSWTGRTFSQHGEKNNARRVNKKWILDELRLYAISYLILNSLQIGGVPCRHSSDLRRSGSLERFLRSRVSRSLL